MKTIRKYLIMLAALFLTLLICPSPAAAEGVGVKLVSAQATDSGYAKITWKTAGSDTNIYVIYRKNGSGSYKPIDYVPSQNKTKQSYTDKTAKGGIKYTYTVSGLSRQNLTSCLGSTEYSFSGSSIQITKNWDAASGSVYRYLIYIDDVLTDHVSGKKTQATYTLSWDGKAYPEVDVFALYKSDLGGYDDTGVSIKLSAIKKSTVTGGKVVATNRARIEWTRSTGADGYILYRRTSKSKKWSKVASVTGSAQTYCYDSKVKKNTTYYYTVKAYQTINGKKKYAKWDSTGKKIKFSSVTVNPKSGDYSSGTVYGPGMTATQRSQVKKAVKSFFTKYITSDMNTVEKLLTAQYFMQKTCKYAPDWSKNGANTAWGALVYKNSQGYHEAQCSGFSRAFKALCDAMNIPCRYVHANSKSANPSHQWCMVKVSGKWYILDPQGNATNGPIMFFFLLGSDEYKGMTGMAWDTKSYPTVSKTSYSRTKIDKAMSGYKVTEAVKRMKK